MQRFDPYLTLGLGRAASADSIKSAYRQRVQTTHPDRGGDPAAFIAVVKAFGLLSDPEARKLYDEAGIVDEDGVKAFRRDVATILADMFDAAVETAVKTELRLERVNFVEQMQAAVATGLADARAGLAGSERDIAGLGALRARITRSDGAENVFVIRLDAQLAARAAEQALLRRRLLILETALVELGNYRSEVELISALEATAEAAASMP